MSSSPSHNALASLFNSENKLPQHTNLMKHIYPFLIGLAAISTASAQTALDLQSQAQLRREALKPAARAAALRRSPGSEPVATGTSYGFVVTDSPEAASRILEAGAQILSTRGNIHLVAMPTDSVRNIALMAGVQRVQLARDVKPKMNLARAAAGIDKIHQGIELPQPYTGAGVITGIVDGGVDPNHVNFKDAAGNPRIKHFTYIRPNLAGTDAMVSSYTPDQLPSFQTDDKTTYHGTHTMGIMAGNYRGTIKVGNGAGTTRQIENPYYGVAPGSEIAASCGQLNDMFIAYGIEGMANYAYNQRKPMVVNLSLGSNLGSHDGRNVMSQYLDMVSRQDNITFCISAGNEGEINLALHKTFTADSTELKTFIHPYAIGAEYRFAQQGSIQIYSSDSTVFDTQVVVYNKSRKRVAFRMAITGNTGSEGKYWVSSSDYAASGDETVSPEFAKAFDGYVGLGSMIDPETGRFEAIVDFMTLNNMTYNADNQYLLGLIVTGRDGKRVDLFCDGVYSDLSSNDIEGWLSGSPDGSISDMACAQTALVVGSYNTRDSWYSLDGNPYGYNGKFASGKISDFSSYGTLMDGRSLPHLCAPGATIISSTSSPYVYSADNGITPEYLQGQTVEGQQGFWQQMAGTSMASPLVAGAVALWLEADPSLKPETIREIAMTTAVRDTDVTEYPNQVKWGAGKFDAYEGLKEVLRRKDPSGITDAANLPLITTVAPRVLGVFVAGASSVSASVMDLSGRCVAQANASSDEVTLDCSALSAGIYVVCANGISQKIIIR